MSNASENRHSTKLSKASTYLSGEENDLVFKLIGRRCQSQCSTVAQLYQTEHPTHHRWIKKYTGALCFVKDNAKRSYYARMFCLIKHEMVWEQEMYDTIEVTRVRPYLLTFEGQDGMIALNFAFEDEAETFLHVAITTVQSRNRRREERKGRFRKEPPARPPPITKTPTPVPVPSADDTVVTLRNPTNNFSKFIPSPQVQSPYQPPLSSKNKTQNRKLTKADIGTPSNFKHVTHIGWNAKSGFDLSGEDDALRPFLQKAGVSENQLKDRRTRDFIYDFIQTNNVEEIVRKETKKPAAPPVPTRHQNQNNQHEKPAVRTAPPPPPPNRDYTGQPTSRETPHRQPAPPLPSVPPLRTTPQRPAQPPPPQNNAPAPPAPPPPPPPPISNMPPPPPMMKESKGPSPSIPAVPDVRNALMESIRKGAQLKKVDASSSSSNGGGDTRNDLLSEIRGGIELRRVSEKTNQANRSSDGTGGVGGTDALADALRRALETRREKMDPSSSDDSDNSEDDGEWSD